jgi:hypothetical protein
MTKPTKLLVLTAPKPTACPRIEDPDQVESLRRLDCQRYDDCLDIAIAAGWSGFHCNSCQAYQPLTPSERLRDHEAILDFLGETRLLATLAEDPDDPEDAERDFAADAEVQ